MFKALQADHLDQRAALRLSLGSFDALLARAIHDISEHGFPGKQRKLLKHRTTVGPRAGNRTALHPCRALGRVHKSADDIEEGRLTTPRWTEDRNEGASIDCQRNV